MWEIRQNTRTTVWVGPYISTDGVTHLTGTTVTYYIAKNNGTFLATTGANTESTQMVAFYKCPLTSDNAGTLGHLTIAAQTSSEYLSVWDHFNVVSQQYWDAKYGTSGFHTDVLSILSSTSSADDLVSLFTVIGKLPTSGLAGSTEIDDLNNVSTTDILDQSHAGVDASTELDDIATVLGALNNVSTTDILTQAQDAVDASTEIDDIATVLGALNDLSTTDILTQAQDAVDASTEIDDIATVLGALNDVSTTDILTQSEAALAAHVVDTSVTMDKALKDMNAKLNNDSYKDGNEYKFYSSTGGYLLSLTIATTERTRSS